MAETSKNSAGEIAVDITGNTDPLKKKLAEMKSESEAAASQVEAKAAAAANTAPVKKTEGLGKAIQSLLAPIRAITTAFTGLIGIFSTFAAVAGLVIYGFSKITEEAKRKRESIDNAKKAFAEYLDELKKTQSEDLSGRGKDPVKTIVDRYNTQMEKEKDLYYQLERAAWKKQTNYKEELTNIIAARDARLAALETEKQAEITALVKYTDAQYKLASDVAEKIARDREEAERKVEETLREERRDSMRQLIDDYREVSDYYARQQRDMMNAQREQFAQLRNDINGLFNTSGFEVGINRIGALIETLIQKTGDSR